MNADIKYSNWMSETEKEVIKANNEYLSKQNERAHDARTSLYKTINFWVEQQTTSAIEDGRITRIEAIRMYDRLTTKIIETCMDTIPAPES